jgi:hypothetical protein
MRKLACVLRAERRVEITTMIRHKRKSTRAAV